MTIRAVILGLLGAASLCGFNYINDNILRQTYLVGNSLPVAVYGPLILFILLGNPVLRRLHRRLALSGRELAVILTLVLAACCVPASGLLRTFTNSLILPHYYSRTNPGWASIQVTDMAPPDMLVDIRPDENTILNGFIQGLGEGDAHISPSRVPWKAWLPSLAFWLPVILTLWFGLIALSVVLHRQWADHELLPYPIADFANSLLPDDRTGTSSILRNKLFLIAAAAVFLLHFNNFLQTWYPDELIRIPRAFDFRPLQNLFPNLRRGGGGRLLLATLYFSVIGFAYFIPKDVSFSVGIGPYIWATLAGYFAIYGISLQGAIEGGGYIGLKPQTFALLGANIGVFLVILYCGRTWYSAVFRNALLLPAKSKTENAAVWAARFFLLCLSGFLFQLISMGLDWQLAILYTSVILVFYVVMCRVLAETGMFYIQPFFFPCVALWGIFGSQALGPKTLLIMFMLTTVLLIDPRESLMPFIINSLRLVDLRQIKVGRTAAWCAVSLSLGLAVALPVTLYFQYDLGFAKWDGWASRWVPQMAFNNVVDIHQKLESQNKLEAVSHLRGWQRFGEMSPSLLCLAALLVAMALALAFYGARLKFSWWPLHPVIFLTWATEPARRLCMSFLVGWFIKTLVIKYGGSSTYQKVKPVMYGLIAGEILGAVLPSIVSLIYYLITGKPSQVFWVLPL